MLSPNSPHSISQRDSSDQSVHVYGKGPITLHGFSFVAMGEGKTCSTSPLLAPSLDFVAAGKTLKWPGRSDCHRLEGVDSINLLSSKLLPLHRFECHHGRCGTSFGEAGLGGKVPFAHLTASEPSTKSMRPPRAKTSSQVSQAFSQACPFTFRLCT